VPVTRKQGIWPHLLLVAALMLLRRPDAALHPQFWAEDGQVFYHDAYTLGWHSLFLPLGGYLNSLCRLTALLAVAFPLRWGPSIFVAVAAVFQLLPAWLMLSPRMAAAIPNWNARLALVYFYALLPNSYEMNLILTNAKWHLALMAFMLLICRPAVGWAGRVVDGALLALSGLDGPFAILLLPVAWLEVVRRKQGAGKALIISATAAVQASLILTSHASSHRLLTPLGASVRGLLHILTNQVFLGGLVGIRQMMIWRSAPVIGSSWIAAVVVLAGGWMLWVALWRGPAIYRSAALFAGAMLFAALLTPVASSLEPQWSALTKPLWGMRYFEVPTLLWFGTGLVFLGLPGRLARVPGLTIILAAAIGAGGSLRYPAFRADGFAANVAAFATAAPGTKMVFPENPPGWEMVLRKDESNGGSVTDRFWCRVPD